MAMSRSPRAPSATVSLGWKAEVLGDFDFSPDVLVRQYAVPVISVLDVAL